MLKTEYHYEIRRLEDLKHECWWSFMQVRFENEMGSNEHCVNPFQQYKGTSNVNELVSWT